MKSDTQSLSNANSSTTDSDPARTPGPVEVTRVGRRRRADAVQNRTRILDAAELVFLESGLNAQLDAIAERADVGRATLFRNFPDRHALVVGLQDRALRQFEDEAARTDGDPDALRRLLRMAAERMIDHAPLIEYWQTFDHDSEVLRTGLKRFVNVFDKPLSWARAAGTCRADLTQRDIFLLVTMMSGTLYARTPETRRALIDRAWTLAVEVARLRDEMPSS